MKIGDLVKHKKAGYTGIIIGFGDTESMMVLTWAGVMEFGLYGWKVIGDS